MRFRTIWSLPGLPLKERLSRSRDEANIVLARLLPQRLRYWVTMSEIGKATMDSPHVPATTVDTVLSNLKKGN